MSEVYEIYKHSWNPDDEMLYVEAEVADSIMISSATQFEPDQWTHGRCMTAFIWNDDPLDVPTKETIFDYINNNSANEWELMVPDDF